MKIVYTTLLMATLFTVVRCTTTKSVTTNSGPGNTELTAAQKKWSDVKMENLTSGHVIYTSKCNTCHGLKNIPDYNEAQWEKLIAVMGPKANLSAQETDNLTKYIYATRETSATKK